jgi:calcineurin-like phosphoesterase family protein
MYKDPFIRVDGTRLRPWASADEADEVMVGRWNKVVRPCDKVYHLGDVAIPRSGLQVLDRLNGDKVLVAGNHDARYDKDLPKYFRAVRAHWKLGNLALSHVPIHPDSLGKFACNVHGHLHCQQVLLSDGSPDRRYFNVSVERINYTPIELSHLKSIIDAH